MSNNCKAMTIKFNRQLDKNDINHLPKLIFENDKFKAFGDPIEFCFNNSLHVELIRGHLIIVSFKKNYLYEFNKIVRKIHKHIDPNAMIIIGVNTFKK
jgi:hypothetical protein